MSGTDKTLFASGSDAALEALLSETRKREPEISEALTARILADAAQASAEIAAARAVRPVKAGQAPRRAFGAGFADWLRALGGFPAAAAFCAALGLGAATGAAAPSWTGTTTQSDGLASLEESPLLISQAIDLLAADDPMEGS
ncbi:hypothetical protein [Neomegalonema perideroedes]|uniref:hypothetical protein n=1 Tax=Neomegalonema perideroedes TaxID=217219 RepID=UPI00035DD844|nr:hypothetical protein [Neomegalonema perideroedes]